MPPEITPARARVALSIAGSDPSGGAGVQADLKTFSALGVYGAAAITALTAQNTRGVRAVLDLPPSFVLSQIEAVLGDLHVDAIKIGMLSQTAIIEAVAAALANQPAIAVVLDPVMVAKGGAPLLQPEAVAALVTLLLPRATLVTPNLPEAAVLLQESEEAVQKEKRRACERLVKLGARAVLLKGGHTAPSESHAERSDDLLFDGEDFLVLPAPRLSTPNTHGTGCTLSAAIAAGLAHGRPLKQAVSEAKHYLHAALTAADKLAISKHSTDTGDKSHGPVHHFFEWWPPKPD